MNSVNDNTIWMNSAIHSNRQIWHLIRAPLTFFRTVVPFPNKFGFLCFFTFFRNSYLPKCLFSLHYSWSEFWLQCQRLSAHRPSPTSVPPSWPGSAAPSRWTAAPSTPPSTPSCGSNFPASARSSENLLQITFEVSCQIIVLQFLSVLDRPSSFVTTDSGK